MKAKADSIETKTFSYFAPLLLFIVLLLTVRAYSQTIQLDGAIEARGLGCPNESVNVTFSPDMKAFTVLFDRMATDAQPMTEDLKKCEISVPVYVEPGYRLRLAQVDHRGFQSLQRGDRSEFMSHFAWIGASRSRPIGLIKNYDGPLEEPLFETLRADQKWEASPCGGSMRLDIETSIRVVSRSGAAMMVLDSLDASLSANSIYRLAFERCDDRIRDPRDPRDRFEPPRPPRDPRDRFESRPPRRPPPPPPPPRRPPPRPRFR
ncbi:MAG TPA: DUF4360 domain-containing protein [Bdellovibrionales bacterium]|nr:DUF4360 domain-containing protein [Bdellovibrionales bacterium]